MSIQAADVHPNYLLRQKITAEQLRRVVDPCVVFEHCWSDSDGQACYAYTVGGILDGKPLGGIHGGATVGGEVIIVHADSRGEADELARFGLGDTVNALDGEEDAYIEAQAALARMSSVSPIRRMDLAMAPDAEKSDEFTKDAEAVRILRGDDIVLTVGSVEGPPN